MQPVIELDLEEDTPERRIFLTDLVARVSSGDVSGIQTLYDLFSPGITFFLRRQLGLQNIDDYAANIFRALTDSIQNGKLTEPVQLVGFVRHILRRELAAIPGAPAAVPPSPHELPNVALAKEILNTCRPREREALVRFHVRKHLPAPICADLKLTEPQLELILERARAAFAAGTKDRSTKAGPGRASTPLSARQPKFAS